MQDLMAEQFNPMVYQADKLRAEIEQQRLLDMERQIQHYMQKEMEEREMAARCNRKVNDTTLHSVFLGIPSLGDGFEHLVGRTPQLGGMINFLNENGFMRAVPLEFSPLMQREEGSGRSLEAPSSQPSIHESKSSIGSGNK